MVDQSKVVVITGGVASGKSTAAEYFAELGVPVIDTDLLAREVVAVGSEGLQRLSQLVGPEILQSDGQLNRALLREKIIQDTALRKNVEHLLHPMIEDLAITAIAQAQGPYCLLAIPLFVESGRFQWVHRVLVVDVPEAVQTQRLMARDKSSATQAQGLLAAQASRQERLTVAHDVINNDGGLVQLKEQVHTLHEKYLTLFSSS